MSSHTLPVVRHQSGGMGLAGVRRRTAEERLLSPRGRRVEIGLLAGDAASLQHRLHPLIDDRGRRSGGQGLERLHQSGGKGPMRLRTIVRHRHLLRCLVLLRCGEDQRGIVRALGRRRPRLSIGQQLGRLRNVARIEGQGPRTHPGADAAADAAAVATVEDRRQVNSLVQRGVEDAAHLAVAHIVSALVRVGGHKRAVCMNILAVHQHGQLVSLAVDAQGAVAGVVKHHRVAPLRQIHQILLHRGQNAVAIGLRRGQHHHSWPWPRHRGIGQQHHLVRRKRKLGAGQQIGHGRCIVHRSIKILELPQLTSAVDAAGGVLRLGSRGLVGVDADQQRALGLRQRLPAAENR
jgi:hypothetical protein